MKKIICLVLTLIMAFSMISVSAFAEGGTKTDVDEVAVVKCFTDYILNLNCGYWEETIECEIIGKYNKYVIFYGSDGTFKDGKILRLVDDYAVSSNRIESPYELGIYVYNGAEVCTLTEAIDKKYFRMADIAHLSDRFTFACDVEKET